MKRTIIDDDFIGRLETLGLWLKNQMTGYFGGNHKTNAYGSTVEFADYREYAPGDDLRRIDWNMYGRFDKYFIRLFTDERQMHNQILIDGSASMEDGAGKADYALKVAAALGYLSVQGMDRTSIKLIQDSSLRNVGQKITGKESFYGTVSDLEEVRFEGGADISAAIKNNPEIGFDDGFTVIISDFFTESDWKQAVDYLLYKKREVLLIQVVTPEEMDPDYFGRMQLVDAEAIEPEDAKNIRMRITKNEYNAYLQALNEYLEDMKQFCRSRNVGYVTVNTANPVEKELLNQLYETEAIR